jgi:hypothetical protein
MEEPFGRAVEGGGGGGHVDHLELAAAVAGRLDGVTSRRLSRHLQACEACATEAYAWGIHVDDEGNLNKRNPIPNPEKPERILVPVGHAGYDMPRRRRRRYPVVWVAGALGFIALGSALLLLPRAERATVAVAQSTPPSRTGPRTALAGMAPPSTENEASVPSPEELSIPTSRRIIAAERATVPQFRVITREEADAKMAGAIRTIPGMALTRFEAGPGSSVPLALPDVEVVRLVYRSPAGELILLDEQRLPVTTDLGDVGMAPGDTLISTDENGVTVALWLANRTLRLSLAGQLDQATIRRILTSIH